VARWLGFAEIIFMVAAVMPALARASDPVVAPIAHTDSLAASSSASFRASDTDSSAPAAPSSGPASSAASAFGAAASADSDQTLFLDVEVNGRFVGKIGEFTLRHGKLMARPDELRDLRFRVPVSRASETGGLVPLSVLPGLTYLLEKPGVAGDSQR